MTHRSGKRRADEPRFASSFVPWTIAVVSLAVAFASTATLLLIRDTSTPEPSIVVPTTSAPATAATSASTASSAPTSSSASSATPATPSRSIVDGRFRVGATGDAGIVPGVYRTAGPALRGELGEARGRCTWSRLRDSSGAGGETDADDVLAEGTVAGPVTVTVRSTDGFFETRGCREWVKQ